MIPVAGGTAVQLTTDPADDIGPVWSPDGSQIAFYSFRSGNRDLWVMPATGGSATQITRNSAQDSDPAWSPDGSQIAFTSDRNPTFNIWVIAAPPPLAIDEESWGGIKGRYHKE